MKKLCFLFAFIFTYLVGTANSQNAHPLGIYGHADQSSYPEATQVRVACLHDATGTTLDAPLNANRDFYISAVYLQGMTSGECTTNFMTAAGLQYGQSGYYTYSEDGPVTAQAGLQPPLVGIVGRVVNASGNGVSGLSVNFIDQFQSCCGLFTTTDNAGYIFFFYGSARQPGDAPGYVRLYLTSNAYGGDYYEMRVYNQSHSIFLQGTYLNYFPGTDYTAYVSVGTFSVP